MFSECFANTQDVKLTKPTDIQNLYTNPLVFHCLFMPRKTISMIAFYKMNLQFCTHTGVLAHAQTHTHNVLVSHTHVQCLTDKHNLQNMHERHVKTWISVHLITLRITNKNAKWASMQSLSCWGVVQMFAYTFSRNYSIYI